jgi:hypothetical protein
MLYSGQFATRYLAFGIFPLAVEPMPYKFNESRSHYLCLIQARGSPLGAAPQQRP